MALTMWARLSPPCRGRSVGTDDGIVGSLRRCMACMQWSGSMIPRPPRPGPWSASTRTTRGSTLATSTSKLSETSSGSSGRWTQRRRKASAGFASTPCRPEAARLPGSGVFRGGRIWTLASNLIPGVRVSPVEACQASRAAIQRRSGLFFSWLARACGSSPPFAGVADFPSSGPWSPTMALSIRVATLWSWRPRNRLGREVTIL